MAGWDTGFVKIDKTWKQDKALWNHSSHKNWYTKYIMKVQNLKNLIDKAFIIIIIDATTEAVQGRATVSWVRHAIVHIEGTKVY